MFIMLDRHVKNIKGIYDFVLASSLDLCVDA